MTVALRADPTMNKIIRYCAALVAATLLLGGCASQQKPGPGLQNGKLTPCSGPPRCVTSEYPGDIEFHVEPIVVIGSPKAAVWPSLKAAIDEMGGIIVRDTGKYLSASFMSSGMKFVDDLECRLDSANGVIQVRSSSRIGYYDFATNRKRVAQLRNLVKAKLSR